MASDRAQEPTKPPVPRGPLHELNTWYVRCIHLHVHLWNRWDLCSINRNAKEKNYRHDSCTYQAWLDCLGCGDQHMALHGLQPWVRPWSISHLHMEGCRDVGMVFPWRFSHKSVLRHWKLIRLANNFDKQQKRAARPSLSQWSNMIQGSRSMSLCRNCWISWPRSWSSLWQKKDKKKSLFCTLVAHVSLAVEMTDLEHHTWTMQASFWSFGQTLISLIYIGGGMWGHEPLVISTRIARNFQLKRAGNWGNDSHQTWKPSILVSAKSLTASCGGWGS